ncbi:adenine phosphoribosyltransferase, partial [Candidatus Woesearchaeota archaeon]|nr:adenine phosphoribosyltransferase [Candidatus Woesearchaeota archaeon]
MDLRDAIRTIPNFPKPGIMFRDITTLLNNQRAFKHTIDLLANRYQSQPIDVIAGIESRGFILGAALADRIDKPFVPIRKKGKLPGKVISQEYALEYGTDKIEMHEDAVQPGQRVLLVDDLIATGGTAAAAAQLIEKLGGIIHECSFVIDLPELGGKQ